MGDRLNVPLVLSDIVGRNAVPHVIHRDPTWAIGLSSIDDRDDSGEEYGRVWLVQCCWDPCLREVKYDDREGFNQ